jgi:hypothetical protein
MRASKISNFGHTRGVCVWIWTGPLALASSWGKNMLIHLDLGGWTPAVRAGGWGFHGREFRV